MCNSIRCCDLAAEPPTTLSNTSFTKRPRDTNNTDDDADYNPKQDDSVSNDSSEEGRVQEGGCAEGDSKPPSKQPKHPGKKKKQDGSMNGKGINNQNCVTTDRKGRVHEEKNVKTIEHGTPEVKKVAVTANKLHIRRAEKGRKKMDKAKQEVDNDESLKAVCVDLQKMPSTPVPTCTKVYYSRQLWTYNFCVHDIGTGNACMYLCYEGQASRDGENHCNWDFAMIDNTKRILKRGVFVPNDWSAIIVQTNRKFFLVKNVMDDDFLALDEIQPLFVKKNEPWTSFYKTTFFEDTPFSKYSMLTKTVTGGVPKELPSLMSERNKKKVEAAKHKVLLDLLPFVFPVHHAFYRSLDYDRKPQVQTRQNVREEQKTYREPRKKTLE
ncbi:hypothetical protein PR048_028163 [Dryococelus australis]|uniref:Uncharacterized protein n=1 Tax=Dryococelus australis TaxID=614101 RepID=A0ABQ9GII1_9NEOP|nr:hypothetical protein PR048_028163 [Dryococelus australis]